MNTVPCSVCSQAGHHARRCPELSAPLQPGFYAPSGGGRYTGDEEDEKLKSVHLEGFAKQSRCPTLAFPSPLKKPSV